MLLAIKTKLIQVIFIPDRTDEIGSFGETKIWDGLASIKDFLDGDEKSRVVGVTRMKMYYDIGKK